MNKGMTVKELMKYCMVLCDNGMGDKHILITSDDEGNEYHTLFYQFTDDLEQIIECKNAGLFHDDNDPNEVVLLG